MSAFQKIFVFILFVCITLLFSGKSSIAQEKGLIQSKYYSTKDYNAGTQNWSIAQDKRGVLYFGNVNGLLEFDGETWRLIEMPNKSVVRSLAVNEESVVFVGAFGELGYMAPDVLGDLKYHSLLELIDKNYLEFGQVWDINCFSDTVFFLTDRYLFRYLNGKFDYWTSDHERFYLSHSVNGKYYVQEIGRGLLSLHGNSLQVVEKGEFFDDIRIHSIIPSVQGMLICSRTDGFFIYDTTAGRVQVKPFSSISKKAKRVNDYFIKHGFYHGIELSSDLYAFGSISNDILILDKNWNVVDIINEETIGIKSSTLYLYFQKNHSLWVALANGICQVEVMSPLRFWNEEMGIDGVITDVARINDKLYVSTGSGIYYTCNCETEEFSLNRFIPVDGSFEQAWSFLYFDTGGKSLISKKSSLIQSPYGVTDSNTILLAATSNGLFQIDGGKSTGILTHSSVFTMCQSKKDPSCLVLGHGKGVTLLSYSGGKWTDHGMMYGIESSIRSIGEDSLGNLWLSARYKGLFRVKNPYSRILDSVKVELFDTSHGLPSVTSIGIFDHEGIIFFSSESNYYTFSNTDNRFEVLDLSSMRDTTEMKKDLYIDSLSWNRVYEDLISNYYVTHHTDSVTWVGTNAGTFKHMGGTPRDYFDLPSALIRRVLSGDSLLFNGTNSISIADNLIADQRNVDLSPAVDFGTVLEYSNNSLTFYYSWPFFESEKPKYYSFYLEGYDSGWSDWSTEIKKEYTNLAEGSYTFKVKAKNFYKIESTPAEFKFRILPPWYRTYLAFIIYLILIVLFIALIVKLYTYRLIKEKEKLEGIVKERTQEILMQNEEILVQAEHLKDANEWISAKNVELEAQKKEIEKKKDQLEVSNATKNKFFRIIAHDLRSPISTLVGSTGYILTDIDAMDRDTTKRFIEELNKLSLTTYNLLENLLDWSTSQMGEIKYNPQPLDLISIVNENLELVKSKIDSKRIELNVSLPENLTVFADDNMVHTVIRNLLTNAVKFTRDNGTIKIFASKNEDFVSLSIADNGVGISKENLEKLFRIDKHVTTPGTHNEKGSGLGLILCKEFVERNGGKIRVDSEPGNGSTFTISLKLIN